MKNNHLNQLRQLIQQHGYRRISSFKKDGFERFNGIFDREGKKYFVKAVVGKDSYKYKSLYWESQVTRYLSTLTKKTHINHNSYRLYIPSVKKIIDQDEIFCFITNYIEGKKLSSASSDTQADILSTTLELISKLSEEIQMFTIQPYLKDYTKKALLLSLPIRFARAAILSPFAFRGLIKASWKSLSLLFIDNNDSGLVHPDINVSNIIFHKKNIYLTDWEEAGWGMKAYNMITVLCVQWQNKILRNILLRKFQESNPKKLTVSLFAYRTLMLFNQHMEKKNKKRKRDFMLLKFLENTK